MKDNLKRVSEEISAAIEIARSAEADSDNPEISAVPANVFKQIKRPLRRALRLLEDKPAKPSKAEQEAEALFELMRSNDNQVVYEIGCVLDEYINGGGRVYYSLALFVPMYLSAREEKGRDAQISFILRELRKGTDPVEIRQRIKNWVWK